jgi:hypothetical protein
VLSLLEYPALLESADAERLFPKDAIARAKSILHDIPGGLGRRHTTRHDTTRHDTTRHDTTRHDTTRHDTTRHDTTQCRL